MKKKIIATLLCASMVATLFTGCGKEEGTTTDPGAAVPEGGTETSDAAATDGEVVKLRMMAYNAESAKSFRILRLSLNLFHRITLTMF